MVEFKLTLGGVFAENFSHTLFFCWDLYCNEPDEGLVVVVFIGQKAIPPFEVEEQRVALLLISLVFYIKEFALFYDGRTVETSIFM